MTSKDDLTELITKAINGDEQAFTNLYHIYAKEIIFYCGTILNDRNETEDAAQEVVLALWRNIGKLQSPFAFKSYLGKVIYAICATRNNRGPKPAENIDDLEDELIDFKGGPAEHVNNTDVSEQIRAMIDCLPKKQRMAVYLHYYDDLGYEEIAQILGVSAGTVGSNLTKARKALEELIMDSKLTESDELKGLVATAIGFEINHNVTDASAMRLISAGDKLIAKNSAAAGKSAALGKTVAVVALAACAFVLTLALLRPAAPEPDPWKPAATIEMTSSSAGLAGQYDPASAKLSLPEGSPISWRVENGSGAVLATGDGIDATAGLSGLPAGSYTLTFTVQNEIGQRADVAREFFIS